MAMRLVKTTVIERGDNLVASLNSQYAPFIVHFRGQMLTDIRYRGRISLVESFSLSTETTVLKMISYEKGLYGSTTYVDFAGSGGNKEVYFTPITKSIEIGVLCDVFEFL